jgi:hypothetical protein
MGFSWAREEEIFVAEGGKRSWAWNERGCGVGVSWEAWKCLGPGLLGSGGGWIIKVS